MVYHRVYRVYNRKDGSWIEWTSINPFARNTREWPTHDRSETMGDYRSAVFMNMIRDSWSVCSNEITNYSITLKRNE